MARHELADFGDMTAEGDRIARRRERLTLNIKDLATEAEVSRDTISDIESGKSFRRTTFAKIEQALDRLEEEAGLPPLSEAPTEVVEAGAGLVTYRVHVGALNVDVTVQGPVENIEELEASVQRLLARVTADHDSD